jgi:hypothetical protein
MVAKGPMHAGADVEGISDVDDPVVQELEFPECKRGSWLVVCCRRWGE